MFPNRVPAGRAWSGIATLAILAGGCFDPTFRDPICGPEGECPSGWTCANGVNQVCVEGTPPGEPDGGGDSGPPDAPVTCNDDQRRWLQTLANGSFESGAESWVVAPADAKIIRSPTTSPTLPVDARDGAWAALLGERDNGDQVLSQVVTIPGGTTRVRFHGYFCFATNETENARFDSLVVRLVRTNDDTATLAPLFDWDNRNAIANCRWDTFDNDVEVAALPEKVELRLAADLDTGNVTTFYLDGLFLEAFACPPALAAETDR